MSFKKIAPGATEISAGTWNTMVDAAEWVQRQNPQFAAAISPADFSGLTALIKNDSGSDVGQYGIFGLGDPIITHATNAAEFKSRLTFIGDTPTTADHRRKFAVMLEPVKDGKIGQGILFGITPVLLDVLDADHTWADVKNSNAAKLETGFDGFAKILWKESGTGDKWSYVMLGTTNDHGIGKADALIGDASSGTVSVWHGTAGSESDTGSNITGYNRTGVDIPSGGWVKWTRINGQIYLETWTCP